MDKISGCCGSEGRSLNLSRSWLLIDNNIWDGTNSVVNPPDTNILMKLVIVLGLIVLAFANIPEKVHPEASLYFTDYCRYFNYPVAYHDVTTEDGYILRVFRVQKKGTQIKEGLKPVLLQHGLLDSSDTWLINDEDKAPAFMLANRGYDVWLSNSRGNKHSRKHVKLNPDKGPDFWAFTFQHMADYDLPAVFTYINSVTSQKIHYVGHSQGTIQMFIALAKRNEVVEQLMDKYFAFGPVAYVSYQTSPIMNLLDKSKLLQWYHLRHEYEFMPSFGWFETTVGKIFCSDFPKVCGDIMKFVMDADPSLDNYNRYDVLVGHDPSGTSVLNMAHWKQILDTRKFEAYDYGSAKENTAHYGQPYPPVWDLARIRQPIRLFAGSSDELADITDVNFLWDSLTPDYKQFFRVYPAGHCTFMWGNNVAPWMNDLFSMMGQSGSQLQTE